MITNDFSVDCGEDIIYKFHHNDTWDTLQGAFHRYLYRTNQLEEKQYTVLMFYNWLKDQWIVES